MNGSCSDSDRPAGLNNSTLQNKFLKGFISYQYLLIKKKKKKKKNQRKMSGQGWDEINRNTSESKAEGKLFAAF